MMQENYELKKASQSSSFNILYHWAGSIPFQESLKLQENFKVSAKEFEFHILGFESQNTVIAMGLRADPTHILWSREKLKSHHVSSIKVRRGGEATLHAPGQLIIYPIVYLPLLGIKVRDFIVMLEQITQNILTELGCQVTQDGQFAGLYTQKGKLCFFGIHISEGVSQHGLSINVDNDLKLFDSIKSCGQSQREHDKLSCYPAFSITKKELFFKWCDKAVSFFAPQRSIG